MNIKKLSQDNYAIVRPLFCAHYPHLPLVYSIIEKHMQGQIWVVNEEDPTACLMMNPAGYYFIAGKLNMDLLRQFFDLFQKRGSFELICEPNTPHPPYCMVEFSFVSIARLQYRYKSSKPLIPNYINDSGYTLQRIVDAKMLNVCLLKSLMLHLYGNADHYLHHAIGFVLWDTKKQRVASEVHGMLANNLVEIATITHEAYRCRKLSTIVCNRLIQYTVKQGWHPIWSVDASNVASRKVAEHQGMQDLMQFYALRASF